MKSEIVFAAVVIAGVAVSSAAQNCAPPSIYGVAPSSKMQSICFSAVDGMPPSTLDDAASMWDGGCSAIGSGIPAFVTPDSGTSCGSTSVYVEVAFNPNPNTQGYDATTKLTPGDGTQITGATITCYVNPCSAQLLAHEMGHVLGLGDTTDPSCDGTVMMQNPTVPRSDFSAACTAADSSWTGPSDSGSNGGYDGGGVLNQCGADGCAEPLLINFDGGAYRLTGLDDPVTFDINATGTPRTIGWTARDANIAFLAIDFNHDGAINDGAELFGNASPLGSGAVAANGFAALRQYDANFDGVIDARDPIWTSLLLWFDRNHDGVSQPDELVPISASSVTAIYTSYQWSGRRDGNGNRLAYEGTLVMGGHARRFFDVFFATP